MSNAVKYAFVFIGGAAIGSVVSWKLLKTRYERIAQEEIDSVKEVFSRRHEETAVEEEEEVETGNFSDYEAEVRAYNSAEVKKVKTVERALADEKPYVIPPENFGEIDEYEKISLTYYSDRVLVDECDELVEDVEDTVGFDSLTHFGEYEDDSVYVRNDRLKCDYEILWSLKRYSEVVKEKPHRVEG